MDICGVFVLFVFYFDAGCLPFIFHSMQGTQSPGISRLVCGLGSKRRASGNALSSAGEDDKEKQVSSPTFSDLPVAQLWLRISPASPQVSQGEPPKRSALEMVC